MVISETPVWAAGLDTAIDLRVSFNGSCQHLSVLLALSHQEEYYFAIVDVNGRAAGQLVQLPAPSPEVFIVILTRKVLIDHEDGTAVHAVIYIFNSS